MCLHDESPLLPFPGKVGATADNGAKLGREEQDIKESPRILKATGLICISWLSRDSYTPSGLTLKLVEGVKTGRVYAGGPPGGSACSMRIAYHHVIPTTWVRIPC